MSRLSSKVILPAATVLALALAACGDGGASSAPAQSGPLDAPTEVRTELDRLYDAAKKAGQNEVIVYTAGVDGPETWEPFTARYPEISVKPVQLIGAEFVAKMDQEVASDRPVGDMVLQGASSAFRYVESGYFADFDPAGSDEIADIGKEDSLASSCVAPYGEAVSIVYNTDKVKEDEAPTGWDDLLDPQWKGRVVFQGLDTPSTTTRTAALLENSGVIDESWLTGLATQDPVNVAEPAQLSTAIIAGQGDIGLARSAFVFADIEKGAPIGQVFPTEGGSVMSANFGCVVEGAPNQEAAELLMGWLLTNEAQEHVASMGYYPFKNGVEPVGGLPSVDQVDNFVMAPAAEEPALIADMTARMAKIFG